MGHSDLAELEIRIRNCLLLITCTFAFFIEFQRLDVRGSGHSFPACVQGGFVRANFSALVLVFPGGQLPMTPCSIQGSFYRASAWNTGIWVLLQHNAQLL